MSANACELKPMAVDDNNLLMFMVNTVFNIFRDDPRIKCLIALSKCELKSIREVARSAEISPTTASSCLKKFASLRIVEQVNLNSNKKITYKFSGDFESLRNFLKEFESNRIN